MSGTLDSITQGTSPALIDIPLHTDDRGSVYCVFDEMQKQGVVRTYVVQNFARGQVRAWHGHKKAAAWLHVIKGSAKLAACPMEEILSNGIVRPFVLTDRKPQLFYVPPGYYNGAMSLEDDTRILVYSTLTFEEVKNDDERAPHNLHDYLWEVKNR